LKSLAGQFTDIDATKAHLVDDLRRLLFGGPPELNLVVFHRHL
jgi:hypothetical protein